MKLESALVEMCVVRTSTKKYLFGINLLPLTLKT